MKEIQFDELKFVCDTKIGPGYFEKYKHIFNQSKDYNCRYFYDSNPFDAAISYIIILYECVLDYIITEPGYKIIGFWFKLKNLPFTISRGIAVTYNGNILHSVRLGTSTAHWDYEYDRYTFEQLLDISFKHSKYCFDCANHIENISSHKLYIYRSKYSIVAHCCEKCLQKNYTRDIILNITNKLEDIL